MGDRLGTPGAVAFYFRGKIFFFLYFFSTRRTPLLVLYPPMKKVSLGQTQFGRLVCENRYKFAIICKREKRNGREKTKCACFLQLLFNHSRNLSQQEMWRTLSLNPAAQDDVFPFEAVSKALRVSRTGSRRTKHSLKNSDVMLSLCHSLLSCISLASLTSTSNILKFRDVYRNLGIHLFTGIDVLVLPFTSALDTFRRPGQLFLKVTEANFLAISDFFRCQSCRWNT